MDTEMSTLLDERLARLTRLAARGFIRALQIRLNQHGVSFGQWIFLRILWMKDGQSQRELAALAGVTEPTTHTALQRLQALDLITRRNLLGNLRRQHVYLTEKGHNLRHQLEPLAVDRYRLHQRLRREVRGKGVRQAQHGGQLGAEQAGAQDPQRHVGVLAWYCVDDLVLFWRSEQGL